MRLNYVIAAFLLLLVAIGSSAVVAQALTVSTDKASYMPGEVVLVSGTSVPGASVGIAAYNPAGTMVFFTMVTAGADGKFSTSIKIPARIPYEDWVYGDYTVEAKVGATTATTSFKVSAAALLVGSVVDEKGNPVVGAEVRVKETAISTLTGADGKFALSVDVGTWTLVVSKAGYVSSEVSVTAMLGVNDVGVIKLVSLESLIAELSAKVESLSKDIDALSAKVGALETQVPALAEISSKLDELSSSLAAVSKAIAELSNKVDANAKSLAAIDAKLSGLEASVKDSLSKVNDALGKVTSTLDALRVDITGLRTDLKAVSDGLKAVSDGMKELATKSEVAAVKSDVAAVSSKVDAVGGAVGGLSGAVYAAVVLALLAFVMSLVVYTTVRKAIAK